MLIDTPRGQESQDWDYMAQNNARLMPSNWNGGTPLKVTLSTHISPCSLAPLMMLLGLNIATTTVTVFCGVDSTKSLLLHVFRKV